MVIAKENNESWTWHNLNIATALIALVTGIALCCFVPEPLKKTTVYQNSNLTIQCLEKKAGACDKVKVRKEVSK